MLAPFLRKVLSCAACAFAPSAHTYRLFIVKERFAFLLCHETVRQLEQRRSGIMAGLFADVKCPIAIPQSGSGNPARRGSWQRLGSWTQERNGSEGSEEQRPQALARGLGAHESLADQEGVYAGITHETHVLRAVNAALGDQDAI